MVAPVRAMRTLPTRIPCRRYVDRSVVAIDRAEGEMLAMPLLVSRIEAFGFTLIVLVAMVAIGAVSFVFWSTNEPQSESGENEQGDERAL
jgi:hypothetical protein